MRISTDLLAVLARAVDSLPSDTDQDFHLAPVLAPILQLVKTIGRLSGFSASSIQRQSFITSSNLNQAASSATQTTTLATLGRGLWHIRLELAGVSSFTQVFDATTWLIRAQFTDPGATSVSPLLLFNVANVPQFARGNYFLLLTEDNWQISVNEGATGAAQTTQSMISIWAEKLL